MSHELAEDRAKPHLEVRILNVLQQLHEDAHEGGVDEAVCNV